MFNSEDDYRKALLIRDCGIDRTRFRDERGEISASCDITLTGQSALMSDLNGYIGLCQMDYVDALIEKQRLQAKKWDKELGARKDLRPIATPHSLPNYWVYGVLADDKIKAMDEFRARGFYASGVHIKNNIYSVFGEKVELKGVDEFYKRFLALPCGWWM